MTLPRTDVGAAVPSPSWCLPDATPDVYQTAEGQQGCGWTRDFTADDVPWGVWVSCTDVVVDGRVLRSAPVISWDEAPFPGVSAAQVRQFAAELLNAAELLDSAAMADNRIHEVTARQSLSSDLWISSCTCGWSASPYFTTEEAEAAGSAHYASTESGL